MKDMEKETKTFKEIYSRKTNQRDAEAKLHILEVSVGVVLVVGGVLIFLADRALMPWLIAVLAAGIVLLDLLTLQRNKINLLDHQLDAAFIAVLERTDASGQIAGESIYYIQNELIMHENMIREDGGYTRVGIFRSRVPAPDKITGPVLENRQRAVKMIHDAGFQEELCAEIIRGHEEYQGWKITPINEVYGIRPGFLGSRVIISGRRGMRQSIQIAWNLENRRELIQRLKRGAGNIPPA